MQKSEDYFMKIKYKYMKEFIVALGITLFILGILLYGFPFIPPQDGLDINEGKLFFIKSIIGIVLCIIGFSIILTEGIKITRK